MYFLAKVCADKKMFDAKAGTKKLYGQQWKGHEANYSLVNRT